jgi:hypothetical protein
VLVYERLLVQATVPDHLAGRVFGVKDALTAWAFGIAFVVAGGLISLVGVRELLVAAGVGGLVVWLVSAAALRDEFAAEAGGASERAERPPTEELSGAGA